MFTLTTLSTILTIVGYLLVFIGKRIIKMKSEKKGFVVLLGAALLWYYPGKALMICGILGLILAALGFVGCSVI